MFRSAVLVILSAIAVSACTTTSVEMTYDQAEVQPASNAATESVTLGSFTDRRGHGTNWLGAIRGGFGNPLKTLETQVPIKDVVKNAYTEGLKARDMLADGDGTEQILRVVVNQFDCNQYVRREAHIKFAVELWDPETKSVVFDRTIVVDQVSGSLFALNVGVFADVEDLRTIANDTLQEAVDKTLDDPGFRAALASGPREAQAARRLLAGS